MAEPSLRQAQTNSPEISEVDEGQDIGLAAEALGQEGSSLRVAGKEADLPKWIRPSEKVTVLPFSEML